MTTKLAQLFDQTQDKIVEEIVKLEAACGYPSEDVRQLADTSHAVRAALTQLNLDPDDTTAKELFHSLSARYAADNQRLETVLGVNQDTSQEGRTQAAEALARHCLSDQPVWGLKRSVAKEALTKFPPLRTKKMLGYRSLDSMLKRQDLAVVYLLLNLVESPSWQKKFNSYSRKLSTSSYELRSLSIVRFSETLKTFLSPGEILSDKLFGAVGINLAAGEDPLIGQVLRILDTVKKLTGQDLTSNFTAIHPSLSWWDKTAHLVAWQKGGLVSLNLFDVAASNSFEERSYTYAGEHFWQKLLQSYEAIKADLGNRPSVSSEMTELAEGMQNLLEPRTPAEEFVAAEPKND